MTVSVYIPSPFRWLTQNHEHVSVDGHNVAEVLDAVNARYPGFDNLVYGQDREVPAHINIYVNNREIHVPFFEGVANQCEGVFETLNMITKMLIHKYLNK